MRILLRVILWLLMVIFLNNSFIFAEVFQLHTVNKQEQAEEFKILSSGQLAEKELGKKIIIIFLKMGPDEKYMMTSVRYKSLNKNPEAIKKIFNKESYYKIDFKDVKLLDKGNSKDMTIKADLYWFMESYEGIQTFYFMLVKEKDQWMVDWMVY